MVKKLLAIQETQVRFLGQKEPLDKETATHSKILAWRTPWTEEPGGYRLGYRQPYIPWGPKELDAAE